jgi:hypothetical protein
MMFELSRDGTTIVETASRNPCSPDHPLRKAWEAYQPLRQGRDSIWAAFEAGFVAASTGEGR